MFEDSLMESGGKIRTNQKTTTTISFIIELIIIGFMILLPLVDHGSAAPASAQLIPGCSAATAASAATAGCSGEAGSSHH